MVNSCFVGRERNTILASLRPQFLRPPLPRALVKRIPPPPALLRITEVRLLNIIGHNDYEAEILSCNGVVQIVGFGAEGEVLRVVGFACSAAWGWVFERA
jgi:hypothetical protein